MGAFLNNLYEEGTCTEIAYWVGVVETEKRLGLQRSLSLKEKPDYKVIMNGNKQELLKELAKVESVIE